MWPAIIAAAIPILMKAMEGKDTTAQDQLDYQKQLGNDPKNYANYLGGYTPEQATAEEVKEDPRMKQMQMDYLTKLMGMSEQGLSDEDVSVFDKARAGAESAARRQNEAILGQMRERGIGGSGAELALRQQANQSAINQQAQSASDQAAAAARQKALYTQAYGSDLGNLRNQDYRTLAGNVDAINKINQFNAANQTDARRYATETQQSIADQNALARRNLLLGQSENAREQYLAEQERKQKQRSAMGQAAGSVAGTLASGKGAKLGAQDYGAIGAAVGGAV